MEKYYAILKKHPLFEELTDEQILAVFSCLQPKIVKARKGQIIQRSGQSINQIGFILEGAIQVYKLDKDGNKIIINRFEQASMFGEALAYARVETSPVDIVCEVDSTILMLSHDSILHTCPKNCFYHQRLIEKMIMIIAKKNIALQNRLEIISVKTLRAKVIRYLESFMLVQGKQITIPFNREELANFLGVERSALSHELSRMKEDGLIDYHKNHFKLK